MIIEPNATRYLTDTEQQEVDAIFHFIDRVNNEQRAHIIAHLVGWIEDSPDDGSRGDGTFNPHDPRGDGSGP